MQGFQVEEKALAEFADLAAGEMDSVFLFQSRADLLARAMADKTFDANIDQDVVADGALGRNQFPQGGSAPSHQQAFSFTTLVTDIDDLPQAEPPMGQRDRLALERLLHMHGTLAERASFLAFFDRDQHSGQNREVTLIPVLQGADLPLQERQRREREGAVFFSS